MPLLACIPPCLAVFFPSTFRRILPSYFSLCVMPLFSDGDNAIFLLLVLRNPASSPFGYKAEYRLAVSCDEFLWFVVAPTWPNDKARDNHTVKRFLSYQQTYLSMVSSCHVDQTGGLKLHKHCPACRDLASRLLHSRASCKITMWPHQIQRTLHLWTQIASICRYQR